MRLLLTILYINLKYLTYNTNTFLIKFRTWRRGVQIGNLLRVIDLYKQVAMEMLKFVTELGKLPQICYHKFYYFSQKNTCIYP